MLDFAHESRLFLRTAATPAMRGSSTATPALSRADRLNQIKAQIADGTYLTDEKLDAALEQMLSVQCH